MPRTKDICRQKSARRYFAAGWFLLLASGGVASVATAASSDVAGTDRATAGATSRDILSRIVEDFGDQAAAPFRIIRTDPLWVRGAFALVASALVLNDGAVDRALRPLKHDHFWIEKTSPIVTTLGADYGYSGAAIFAGYSYAFGTARDRETSIMLGEALLTSGVWAQIGKMLHGQERPEAAYDNGHLNPFWHGPLAALRADEKRPSGNYNAFPSCHTTTAFAIATIFATQYGNGGWLVP